MRRALRPLHPTTQPARPRIGDPSAPATPRGAAPGVESSGSGGGEAAPEAAGIASDDEAHQDLDRDNSGQLELLCSAEAAAPAARGEQRAEPPLVMEGEADWADAADGKSTQCLRQADIKLQGVAETESSAVMGIAHRVGSVDLWIQERARGRNLVASKLDTEVNRGDIGRNTSTRTASKSCSP